jgi:hypothetical protein
MSKMRNVRLECWPANGSRITIDAPKKISSEDYLKLVDILRDLGLDDMSAETPAIFATFPKAGA